MTNKIYSTQINKSELDEFQKSCEEGVEKEFIENYIKTHFKNGVHTKEDVHSLVLSTAILYENTQIANYILNNIHQDNILTNPDASTFSPLTTLLYNGNEDIFVQINKYMKKIPENADKSDITEAELNHLANAICQPSLDSNKINDPIDYLRHFYSEEAITKLCGALEYGVSK